MQLSIDDRTDDGYSDLVPHFLYTMRKLSLLTEDNLKASMEVLTKSKYHLKFSTPGVSIVAYLLSQRSVLTVGITGPYVSGHADVILDLNQPGDEVDPPTLWLHIHKVAFRIEGLSPERGVLDRWG